MRIKNEELKFKIYNILKKEDDEEITEDELKSITAISINKKDYDAQDIVFEENDFQVLKYVERLTLNLFEINDELVKQIALLENLNTLILNHCTFQTKMQFTNSFKNLMISYPKNLDLEIFTNSFALEMFQLVEAKVDLQVLKKYENLQYLYLYNSQIEKLESLLEFQNLKEVGLDGSNISEEVLKQIKNKNIMLHYADEYLPV